MDIYPSSKSEFTQNVCQMCYLSFVSFWSTSFLIVLNRWIIFNQYWMNQWIIFNEYQWNLWIIFNEYHHENANKHETCVLLC